MKKIIFLFAVIAAAPLLSFSPSAVSGARVISITDPFTESVEVCYDLPSEGDVEIKVTNTSDNRVAGDYHDKQGHGTHCAGIACAPGGTGVYQVDFYFESEHQVFYIQRR